jgi:hypothetical protein
LSLSCIHVLQTNRYVAITDNNAYLCTPKATSPHLCGWVLMGCRGNYSNLEESLPETELRKMAAAALQSFLARLAGVPV